MCTHDNYKRNGLSASSSDEARRPSITKLLTSEVSCLDILYSYKTINKYLLKNVVQSLKKG